MSFLTVLLGIIAVVALAVYFFGIPPQWKREMERKALETMGENKASYLIKGKPQFLCDRFSDCVANAVMVDQISKIPASDQQEIKDFKKGLGNALGGAANNPLGKEGGEFADKLTSPFSGR